MISLCNVSQYACSISTVFVLTPPSIPTLGPIQLPPGGYSYAFTHPGGGASGLSLFLQAMVLDGSTNNGAFASTDLLDVRLH